MKLFTLFFLLMFSVVGFSQTDTLHRVASEIATIKKAVKPKPLLIDTTKEIIDGKKDSSQIKHTEDSIFSLKKDSIAKSKKDTTAYKLLSQFPLINNNKPEYMFTSFKEDASKDALFYLLICNVFLLALIQILFPRYFRNVFNIFFQTSFRQKQTREQLTQENIAALLLNIIFIISASTFITLVSDRFKITHISFWNIFTSVLISLIIIYAGKLLFTQFMGWIFNKKEIAQSYSFIIFIVNKIIGVALIPLIFLLAFSTNSLQQLSFSIAIMVIVFLFLFRFFNTYKNLSSRLKINAFHFFLYFCSVEILPLLIIYKVLNNYLSNGV